MQMQIHTPRQDGSSSCATSLSKTVPMHSEQSTLRFPMATASAPLRTGQLLIGKMSVMAGLSSVLLGF